MQGIAGGLAAARNVGEVPIAPHRHAGGVGDHGAELGLADRFRRGGNNVVAVGDVGADEADAGVRRGRPDGWRAPRRS